MVLKKLKYKNYQFGIYAEKVSLILLWLKGYKILAWRYKSYFGEIDIIAKKSTAIIFVEVKARRKEMIEEEVLKKRQILRIKKAAEFFIAKNPDFQNCDLRFDFIEVRGIFLFKHKKNFIS